MTDPWDAAPIVKSKEKQVATDPWDMAESKEDSLGVMAFVNKAIAATGGAPVDVVTAGLNLIPGVDIQEPFGGSKSIEKGMESVGIDIPDREPETMPEYIGTAVGEVATLMIPIAKTAQALSKGTGLVANIASNITKSIAKHPYVTMASELTGGVGAGVGRGAGETIEDPALKATAELTGGIVGGALPTLALYAPTAVAIRIGKKILNKIQVPFTKKGATYRAGEFVKGKVSDTEKVVGAISEETISDLPPVIASGEKKLVELYKGLIGQDPSVDAEAIESISKSIIKLEGEMRKLGYGSPELLAEITTKRVAAIELSMDTRIIKTMESAQNKLDKLPVAQRKVNESRIVRNELENTMRQEQAKTQKLWQAVDKDLEVGIENTRNAYADIIENLPQAQKVDLPASLKGSDILKEGDDIPIASTIKEMQGLRSKLLETQRTARKDGQWNTARIAGDMADAILDDIDGSAGDDALKAAIASTKQFKTRFEQGTVGKILGFGKSGAPAIDPDITLDISIGRMGQRGSLDIEKIAITPEAIEATKRYINRSFTDFALDNTGKINPAKAERWIKNNEAILDKFPGMQKQLSDVGEAQRIATDTKIRMDARKKALRNPKISVSARYLNAADMGIAVDSILKAKNPSKVAFELVKQAKKDATGDALMGLRSGFIDSMLDKSSIGAFNELGEQTLSGRTLLSLLNRENLVLKHVFEPEQIMRMKQIGTELAKIETFSKMGYKPPDIELKDFASSALRLLAKIGGARLGGWMGKESAGGSLQMAGIYSSAAGKFVRNITKDHAQQMIHDAITSKDPALLKTLLLPIDKPGTKATEANLKKLSEQINLWLAGTGKRVIDNITDEELTQEK